MKDPKHQSIDLTYCKILDNYYNIIADAVFGIEADSVFHKLLYVDHLMDFSRTEYRPIWENCIEYAESIKGLKRLATFRLGTDPVVEIKLFGGVWNYKMDHNLFLTATQNSILSEWFPCHLELNKMPYSEYLKTWDWEYTRDIAKERAKHRCQLCYKDDLPLHVHHRTYDRRGNEDPSDLIVLCSDCHTKFHDKLPNSVGIDGG